MRVLLDECVPRKIKNHLGGHDFRTVPEMGWGSKRNSELLQLAAGKFDALITVDRSFAVQQNRSSDPVAIVLLAARSNRLVDLLPLVPQVEQALSEVKPGEVRRIRA